MDILAKLRKIEDRHRRDMAKLEGEAFRAFCKMRWPPKGEPFCPKCGHQGRFYFIVSRRRHRCAFCARDVSPTQGTIFGSSKLTYVQMLRCFAILTANPDMSARQLGMTLGLHYKSIYVLHKKYRATGGALVLNEAAKAWAGYWQKPRAGRVVRPYRRHT